MLVKKALLAASLAITMVAGSSTAKAISTVHLDNNDQAPLGGLQVSPELFSVIEQWQDGYANTISLKDYVLNKDPELFNGWLNTIVERLGDRSIIRSFKTTYSDIYDAAEQRLSIEITAKVLLEWAASMHEQGFKAYQDQELQPMELDLENYLERISPRLLDQWLNIANTPIKQNANGTFIEYLDKKHMNQRLKRESQVLLDHFYTKDIDQNCACEVITTFDNVIYNAPQPNPDLTVIMENTINQNLRERRYIKEIQNAAAHSANLVRFNRHGASEFNAIDESQVTPKITILCMSAINGACESGSCSAELDIQANYGSKLWVKTEASGGPLAASKSLASDSAIFTYDPPGSAPEQILFNKGLVLARRQNTIFDVDAFAELIGGTLEIFAVFATNGATLADLETDLVSDLIKALFGVIVRDGHNGESHQNFFVKYDSNTASPFQITSGDTNVFDLKTTGQVYANGWAGARSWSWGSYNSSYWLAGAVKNFSCNDGVIPPSRTGFWSYATVNGPYTNDQMANNIDSFLLAELGYTDSVSNYTNTTGAVTMNDPKLPVAVCDIAPSTIYGSGTATFFGNNSFDPDGSIVDHEWFVDGNAVGNGGFFVENFSATSAYMTSYPISLKVTDDMGLTSTISCGSVNVCDPSGCTAEGTSMTFGG